MAVSAQPAPRPAPELRPVSGPSALGGGARRFFDLLWLISVTEFKKTYYGTVFGYFWSLVRPAVLFAVLLFVFTRVIRIGGNVPHYPVLLLLNIVIFTFFTEVTLTAVTSVVGQEGIVRKTQFPRLVIPLAVVVTGIFNLLLNLIPVFIFILAFGVTPTATWLLFPVILLLVGVLTVAVSMLLSALYVRYRDVAIIWGVAATVFLYATPILYPSNFIPPGFRTLIQLNPLVPIFEQMRTWIIDPGAPGALTSAGSWGRLLISVAVYAAVCVLAVFVFRREAPRIAEEL